MADNSKQLEERSRQTGTDRLNPEEIGKIHDEIVDALRTVFDPEIPVNIYELGLIYQLEVSDEGAASIQMTLTSPACPVAGSLPGEVEAKARSVSGVKEVSVELVWDPPWEMEKMSEEAKLELGLL